MTGQSNRNGLEGTQLDLIHTWQDFERIGQRWDLPAALTDVNRHELHGWVQGFVHASAVHVAQAWDHPDGRVPAWAVDLLISGNVAEKLSGKSREQILLEVSRILYGILSFAVGHPGNEPKSTSEFVAILSEEKIEGLPNEARWTVLTGLVVNATVGDSEGGEVPVRLVLKGDGPIRFVADTDLCERYLARVREAMEDDD